MRRPILVLATIAAACDSPSSVGTDAAPDGPPVVTPPKVECASRPASVARCITDHLCYSQPPLGRSQSPIVATSGCELWYLDRNALGFFRGSVLQLQGDVLYPLDGDWPRSMDIEAYDSGRGWLAQRGQYLDPGPGVPETIFDSSLFELYRTSSGQPSSVMHDLAPHSSARDIWDSPSSANVWVTLDFDGQQNEAQYIARWNGTTLLRVEAPASNFDTGYAVDPEDAWTSSDHLMWHYREGAWTSQGNAGAEPRAFWGADRNTYFSVGSRAGAPVVLRWDGAQWSTAYEGAEGLLSTIWGSASDDVWVGGYDASGSLLLHHDGASWQRIPSEGRDITSIRGNGRNDVVIAGAGGWLAHWNGSTLDVLNSDFGLLDPSLDAWQRVWGTGDDVYVVSNKQLVHTVLFAGQRENWERVDVCGTCDVTAVGGIDANDFWVASAVPPGESPPGGSRLHHFSNGTWTLDAFAPPTKVTNIVATSTQVWLLSDSGLHRFSRTGNGPKRAWSTIAVTNPGRIRDLAAIGDDAWAVFGGSGDPFGGDLYQWNGSSFDQIAIGSYSSVFARSANEVYVSGIRTIYQAELEGVWLWNGTYISPYSSFGGTRIRGDATHLWLTPSLYLDSGTGFAAIPGAGGGDAYFHTVNGAIDRGILIGYDATSIYSYKP